MAGKRSSARGPPTEINDCLRADEAVESRPIKVDLFIATYSEDVELVRLSIRDAMQMTYPGPLDYKVHVLDDGRRPEMKAVCEQEGRTISPVRAISATRPVTCATGWNIPMATF